MNLAELETLPARLLELESKVKDLLENTIPRKPWYTRDEAMALKHLTTTTCFRSPWLLPNYGEARKMNSRQTGWTDKDVQEWLYKDADTLEREWRQHRKEVRNGND